MCYGLYSYVNNKVSDPIYLFIYIFFYYHLSIYLFIYLFIFFLTLLLLDIKKKKNVVPKSFYFCAR